jgi:phage terminase large subunit-like protein
MSKTSHIVIISILLFSLVFSGFIGKPFPEQNVIASSGEPDTTSFSPNTGGGWGFFAFYIFNHTPDSVQFEIILKRNGRIDGKTDQQIGTIINPAFIPEKNQAVDYYLLGDNVWKIRITKDGDCFLKQDRGSALRPSSLAGIDVIPISIRYKIN